ncbi:RrF2 family transcriptional regulator, partial [Eggerthella sinensis]
MLVSTKGRYALRLMVCVAQSGAGGKVALREASEREGISLKYLEQLARPLVQAGLLRSVRGKG